MSSSNNSADTKLKVSRRNFLKVIGAAGGAAATGCARQPVEKIIPYLNRPAEVIPGVATWYTGTCGECQAGCGVLVRTREGRAVKVEGNPAHPMNRGGLCLLGQSSLQTLYDPDRVREPLARKPQGAFAATNWEDALGTLHKALTEVPEGKQAVLLTGPLSGSLETLVSDFAAAFPNLRHVTFDFGAQESVDAAAAATFGPGVRTHFDFSAADVIVSFGAGYLETWVSPVMFSKQWAETRRPERESGVSYVVQVEPRLSLTAANADHWVCNAPGSELELLRALLKLISEGKGTAELSSEARSAISQATAEVNVSRAAKAAGISKAELEKLAAQLSHAPRSLVVAGGASVSGENAVACGVVANLLNVVLGNVGRSVLLEKRAPRPPAAIEQLIGQMNEGEISVMLVAGVNPYYLLPDSSEFRRAFAKVGFIAALSTNLDETASQSQLVLPQSTSFESWGDGEALPGVFNLNQPAMQPLYESLSLGDLLIALAGKSDKMFDESRSFYDYIRSQWKKRIGAADFERKWLKTVEAGGIFEPQNLSANTASLIEGAGRIATGTKQSRPGGLQLIAFQTVRSVDGSAANRPWTQEIPDPLTTAVWGSWVEIHPALAAKQGLTDGQVAIVSTEHGALRTPVFITKHIHENAIAIPVGNGHEQIGRYGNGVGVNVLRLLSFAPGAAAISMLAGGVKVSKDSGKGDLVTTQGSSSQLDRGIVRWVSADDLHHQHGIKAGHHAPEGERPQMYRQMEHPLYRWGMSIDLSVCTGCSACVAACYAENNVPVVGRELVREGREMSWIRISRYFNSSEHRPIDGFIPMLCQHCGNAPCEPVCPVYATYHTEEGLNHMVYNRCVGTRYCSNNCPYKVRRFNWFKYDWPEPLTWQLNPDVTVREVGVMEKCTFCIQRIRDVQHRAKDEGRKVADGEISPACASSCPTNAIVFGDKNEPDTLVSKLARDVRSYQVLDEHLNTQPAINYMARVVHPDAAKGAEPHGESEHH